MPTSAHSPYPPLRLANRVCSLEGRGDPVAAYESLGQEARGAITELLPGDWTFEGKRVLDFGCGAGRTLRHFLSEAEAPGTELWGSDIDAGSIDWLQRELCPPLHAQRNGEWPPLGLEYGSFDLIWALSVFTHLTDASLPWLVELHRLLKPGGLLIATYMGRWNSEFVTGEPWDENSVGMNVLRPDQPWDSGGPMVLMSDWWVEEHWGRAFKLVARSSNVHGQTWPLLRKRDVEATVEALERPSTDPREYAALRNNVRQVERDRQEALTELRQEYEDSLSWRLTQPLRTAGRRVREARAARNGR